MIMFLLSAFAFAQTAEKTDLSPSYAKETFVDFLEMEVNGDIVKPEMTFITDHKPLYGDSLLQLRVSFVQEIHTSVTEIN